MKVIVVGAGIAGLTLAHSLRVLGIECTVVEQQPVLREIGAGVQIAANGVFVLRRLGLEEALARLASRPLSYDWRELESGTMLFSSPLGEPMEKRYGAPMYQAYRPDLLAVLGSGLPEGTVRLDAGCVAVAQDGAGASVRLATGETLRADAVIGADGIHSAVRRGLRGEEKTRFVNILMWRAMIPGERLRSLDLDPRGHYWVGPGRTVITYWVRPGKLFNFLGSVPSDEVHRESWTDSGDVEDMRRSFAGAEPRVRAMLDAIDTAFITGMYYHDPIESWCEGRIAMIGDAAHAMVPFLAQGACQAMEDAWTVASCLAKHGEAAIPAALIEYERRRRPRVTRVQAAARAMVKLVHETDPVQIRSRNGRWKGVSRIDPLAETSWGWLFDHDILAQVERPVEEVLGLAVAREGKRMQRKVAQQAFDLWKGAFTAEDLSRGHVGLREGYERFLRTSFPASPTARATTRALGGVPALEIAGHAAGSHALLHFHGGGYVMGSAATSIDLAARIGRTIGARSIWSVDYRLAPEHAFPAALDDAVAAYRALVASGVAAGHIVLSGESAGGGLVLALVRELLRGGEPLPAGVVALSPFADLTLTSPTIDLYVGDDPAANRINLTTFAGCYFQGEDPEDPRISPVFADFTGCPPLFLAAAREEALIGDATKIAERARAAGVDVSLEIVDDSVHVFPLFAFLPETDDVMAAIAAFAARI